MPNPIRNFLAGHFLSVQPDGMNDELWAKRKVLLDRAEHQLRQEGRLQEATRQGRMDVYETISPGPSPRPALQQTFSSFTAPAQTAPLSPRSPAAISNADVSEFPLIPGRNSSFFNHDDTPETTPAVTRAPSQASSTDATDGSAIPARYYPPYVPDEEPVEAPIKVSHDMVAEDEDTEEAKEALDEVPAAKPVPTTRRQLRNQNVTSMPPWRLERSEGQTEPQGWNGKGKQKAWI